MRKRKHNNRKEVHLGVDLSQGYRGGSVSELYPLQPSNELPSNKYTHVLSSGFSIALSASCSVFFFVLQEIRKINAKIVRILLDINL